MLPLSECPSGSKVRIIELGEDRRCRCRLFALGLTPGVEAEVRVGGECCMLSVRGSELCLGRVDIHLSQTAMAARCRKERNDVASLSYLLETLRNCLSLLNMRSMTFLSL